MFIFLISAIVSLSSISKRAHLDPDRIRVCNIPGLAPIRFDPLRPLFFQQLQSQLTIGSSQGTTTVFKNGSFFEMKAQEPQQEI